MPYVSKKQEAWAHTSSGEEALGGPSKVAEWDSASKGKDLPVYAKSRRAKLRKRGVVSDKAHDKHLSKYGPDEIDASSR